MTPPDVPHTRSKVRFAYALQEQQKHRTSPGPDVLSADGATHVDITARKRKAASDAGSEGQEEQPRSRKRKALDLNSKKDSPLKQTENKKRKRKSEDAISKQSRAKQPDVKRRSQSIATMSPMPVSKPAAGKSVAAYPPEQSAPEDTASSPDPEIHSSLDGAMEGKLQKLSRRKMSISARKRLKKKTKKAEESEQPNTFTASPTTNPAEDSPMSTSESAPASSSMTESQSNEASDFESMSMKEFLDTLPLPSSKLERSNTYIRESLQSAGTDTTTAGPSSVSQSQPSSSTLEADQFMEGSDQTITKPKEPRQLSFTKAATPARLSTLAKPLKIKKPVPVTTSEPGSAQTPAPQPTPPTASSPPPPRIIIKPFNFAKSLPPSPTATTPPPPTPRLHVVKPVKPKPQIIMQPKPVKPKAIPKPQIIMQPASVKPKQPSPLALESPASPPASPPPSPPLPEPAGSTTSQPPTPPRSPLPLPTFNFTKPSAQPTHPRAVPTPAQPANALPPPIAIRVARLGAAAQPFFACAKCRILRSLRFLSRDPAHLSAGMVGEGYAPLCTYCVDGGGSGGKKKERFGPGGVDNQDGEVRWCAVGGHESFRAEHRGMAPRTGEAVELAGCLRCVEEEKKKGPQREMKEVVGPLGEEDGEVEGDWEGWKARRGSDGLWVVEGDGGRWEREKKLKRAQRNKAQRKW